MAVAHYQLGIALNQTGDMDRAATEWHEATRVVPNMVEAQRMLALYSIQKGDMPGLESVASKIIEFQPTAPDGYAMRAQALMRQKQYPGAEQDARKAIELAPQAPAGYFQMGELTARQGQFAQSESWYKQALNRDKNSAEALRGLLNVYLAQKQTDKAIAAANQQIAISPDNSMFYDLLGSVHANKRDYASAAVAFKKAVELNKQNADAYLKLGQAQLKTNALDDALATGNAGLQNNPRESAFYMLLGSAYERKNDLANAKSSYEKVLQIKPDDPLASNNLAYVLLETNSNPDLALRLAQTARRGLPELSNVADTLGWAFYQKGIYESAITMFQEAIKLSAKNKEPESATYHYHLGLAYAKSEQPALAKQHLERTLKIDPKYSDADDVRKQLAQLKS
jgi:tetratricopeptide (TPR) repeat protein